MPDADTWERVVAELEPHVSPRWATQARAHGSRGWIRLIALVDAHNQLSNPSIDEKIAMTMADLASGHEKEKEVAGWSEVHEKAKEARVAIVTRLVDAAPEVLSEELLPFFTRSVDPAIQM